MVKRMHIMESQSSNRGGTDFPCYYDEKNDEYYEASWNTDYGFAFGYWPIDYYHTEYEFCVSNPYMMHSNACGIAAREYFENYLDSEISDESTSLEDALYDLMNDFKEYGYSYDITLIGIIYLSVLKNVLSIWIIVTVRESRMM